MALLDTARPAATPFGFTAMISRAIGAAAAWNDARITRKSLSQLTARELDDIGLTYSDIHQIASRITR